MTYRVLTVKEQSSITALLTKANEALVEAAAIVGGDAAAPAEKKTRKPRAPKAVAPVTAIAADAPKKRGRPAKVQVEAPSEI